jgi:hypothetical protein
VRGRRRAGSRSTDPGDGAWPGGSRDRRRRAGSSGRRRALKARARRGSRP